MLYVTNHHLWSGLHRPTIWNTTQKGVCNEAPDRDQPSFDQTRKDGRVHRCAAKICRRVTAVWTGWRAYVSERRWTVSGVGQHVSIEGRARADLAAPRLQGASEEVATFGGVVEPATLRRGVFDGRLQVVRSAHISAARCVSSPYLCHSSSTTQMARDS